MFELRMPEEYRLLLKAEKRTAYSEVVYYVYNRDNSFCDICVTVDAIPYHLDGIKVYETDRYNQVSARVY